MLLICLFVGLFIHLFLGSGLPQKGLGPTEEVSGKKHTEDTISVASSLHSSPPASPQSSPRKGKKEGFPLMLLRPNSTSAQFAQPFAYRLKAPKER